MHPGLRPWNATIPAARAPMDRHNAAALAARSFLEAEGVANVKLVVDDLFESDPYGNPAVCDRSKSMTVETWYRFSAAPTSFVLTADVDASLSQSDVLVVSCQIVGRPTAQPQFVPRRLPPAGTFLPIQL
jgi:hypothetical protein